MSTDTSVTGFVYILRPVGHNVYKIGCTTDLDRRIKTMRRKYDFEIEYVAFGFYEDYNVAETTWHRHFKTRHLIGEWFILSQSDLDFFKDKTS